jgi:outer membrane protein assembly factor BamB
MMSSVFSPPFRTLPGISITRRSCVSAAVGTFIAASGRRGFASTQTSENTVLYRGNPARTGVISSTGPKNTPGLKWQREIGRDVTVKAAPLIVGSVAYVGDLDGNFWAHDVEDGSVRWSEDTTMGVWSSAAYASGVIFFGNQFGIMSARSAETGEQIWKVATGENIESSPLVVDGVVYFGGWNGTFYALDARDGTERWTVDLGDMLRASPTYHKGRVYIPGDFDGVYAFDAASGDVVWHFTERDVISPATAALADRLLYVASGAEGDVIAIDTERGTMEWQRHLDEFIFTAPAVANGRVYIASESMETANIHALDATTGEEIWRFEPLVNVTAAPIIADDVLYVVDTASTVYALEPGDGSEHWRLSIGNLFPGELMVWDGALYAGYQNGVIALDEER